MTVFKHAPKTQSRVRLILVGSEATASPTPALTTRLLPKHANTEGTQWQRD